MPAVTIRRLRLACPLAILAIGAVACTPPTKRTIDKVTVEVVRLDRLNRILEPYYIIEIGSGEESIRVTIRLSEPSRVLKDASDFSESIEKLKRWKMTVLTDAGTEIPILSVFGNPANNDLRIYTNPVPRGTRVATLVIQNSSFNLNLPSDRHLWIDPTTGMEFAQTRSNALLAASTLGWSQSSTEESVCNVRKLKQR